MPSRAAPKRLTHFLCIPLVTSASRPQLQQSLQGFRTAIKDDRTPENPNGIPEKAIRPLGSLHLTLGVMSLLSQERVDGALAVLQSLNIPSLLSFPPAFSATGAHVAPDPDLDLGAGGATDPKQGPLNITLRGLASMHAPDRTSVLYSAPEDPDGRLYAFCSRLKDAMADFLVPDTRPLLLHATLMNTVYVPGVREKGGGTGSGHGRNRAKLTVDARGVLERYAEVMWMQDVKVEKVAICRMGARRVKDAEGLETGDEEYVVEGEVNLPDV